MPFQAYLITSLLRLFNSETKYSGLIGTSFNNFSILGLEVRGEGITFQL